MNNKISIIVPVFNESKNIRNLLQNLLPISQQLKGELIIVDDGSTDDTAKVISSFNGLTLLTLRKNFGQTAALLAGIQYTKSDIIVTLDGDGQNNPEDIYKLIKEIKTGADVVCGWRLHRKDSFSKKMVSWGAYQLRKYILGDKIHDSGCTLRAYRKQSLEGIDLYGEMHRFIPALLSWKGFKVTEVIVGHYPRKFGASKYRFSRIPKGFIDMLTVWFWYRYSTRPLHLFGSIGILLIVIGSILLAVLAILRLWYRIPLSDKIWPLVGFFNIIAGIQLFVAGILADIAIKSYFLLPGKSTYSIKSIKKL